VARRYRPRVPPSRTLEHPSPRHAVLALVASLVAACGGSPVAPTASATPTRYEAPSSSIPIQGTPIAIPRTPEPTPLVTLVPGSDAAMTLRRIALGACLLDPDGGDALSDIADLDPELMLWLGDNVYGDRMANAGDVEGLRSLYGRLGRNERFQRLAGTTEFLATWDDHDYGKNDAGVEWEHKDESQQLFLDFFGVPKDDPRRKQKGVYSAEVFGPPGKRVQVILLDMRWFRSPLKPTDQRGAPGKERYVPDPDPAKTMLGETQWAWLAEELRRPAEIRLLVSSIQVLAEGHGWERWGNFPREQQKLYDTIRTSGAKGVVLLSGDRHIGALYREQPAGLYPLVELTSSGLNKAYREAKEPGPNRLGELYAAPNFGVVEIDWDARKLAMALHDEAGIVQRSASITFDELQLAK